VILTGGIDLSVGSIIALSSVMAAMFARGDSTYPLIAPILVAVATGLVIGAFNGLGVAYGKYPPFIMTLATMIIVRGLGLVITEGRPIFNLSDAFVYIANGSLLGLPNLIYFLVICFVLGFFVLNFTVFGKRVYAVGGNEIAAGSSGINVRLIKFSVYAISGLLAGLCGVLMASRITSGNASIAEGYELDAIAATVIGGVSMSGGVGSILGTLVGALIIGVIKNGLDILSVSPYYQKIIQGSIILIAVFLDIRSKAHK
jgi:ribose/xylose/arabinose/galactoside ABC-type transport system permease subunit